MPFEKGKSGNAENQFEQGVSGNPSGRTKGSLNRSTLLRKWLSVRRQIDADKNPKEKEVRGTVEDEVVLALIYKALEGDVSAIREIQDSLHGKILERRTTDQGNFNYDEADLSILNAYELERITAGDDARTVFASARARRIREAAQAADSKGD